LIAEELSTLTLPDEISDLIPYYEGMAQQIVVNRYERDPRARAACIRYHGTVCHICGMDFATTYGSEMAGFIHVHHLTPLADVGPDYIVDPINDLRPVCPNCHAVIHRRQPPYTIDEVRSLMNLAPNRAEQDDARERPSSSVLNGKSLMAAP
jgi:5-methylcytosine-specific restriction protein A